MERADIYAAMIYEKASNKEEKFYAFMDGYRYAHKEMKEEMKKFTQGFSYKKESE